MNKIEACVNGYGARIGRVLIGLLFVVTGVQALLGFQGFVGYVGTVFPFAVLFALAALVLKLGGGLGLILGIRVRLSAYALMLFTAAAVIFFHLKGAIAGNSTNLIMGLKDLAIFGGLLIIAQSAPEGQLCMGTKDTSKTEGMQCEGGKCEGHKETRKETLK